MAVLCAGFSSSLLLFLFFCSSDQLYILCFAWAFPPNKEKYPIFFMLWQSYKKVLWKAVSRCVFHPPNLLTEVTSITKNTFLFFPATILFPSFLFCCIVWPTVLILLFCLFFTLFAQSLILLAVPSSTLYLSMVLIIWLMLPGSWPHILHSGFKSSLPSIFNISGMNSLLFCSHN